MKMKAAVLREAGRPLVIEELDVQKPARREAGVELVASGVCHTDLHFALGHFPLPMPIVLGHEGAGIVREVGPGVSRVAPGDHVVMAAMPSCGSCKRCLAGEPYLCQAAFAAMETGTLLSGETRLSSGGERVYHLFGQSSFAEYAVVHESTAIKVSKDAPLDVAALLACGVTTGIGAVIHTAQVRPGDTVAVFGCGGVGLSAVLGAALVGAAKIIAIDVLPRKLEVALTLGATAVIHAPRENPVEAVLELTNGGADHAFECVGDVDVMAQAYQVVRPGGKAVICGAAPAGSMLTIDPDALLQGKAIVGSAAGSTHFGRDVPRLLDLFQKGRLPIDKLISHTFRLEEINLALSSLQAGDADRCMIRIR